MASIDGGVPSSYYRRRSSSRDSRPTFSARHTARPGGRGDEEGDEEGEEHSGPPSRDSGVRLLSSGTHGRGRRAAYEDNRELSSVRRGSVAMAPSMPTEAGRHESSWSPVSNFGVHFGREIDRGRARSKENGPSIRRAMLPSASTTPAGKTTNPGTADTPEGYPSGAQNWRRWSRGPSLPSVSYLVGTDYSDENPGQGCQGLTTEERWGRMVNTVAVEVRDGTVQAQEEIKNQSIPDGKPELSGDGRGEVKEGNAGWPRCEAAGTNGKERGPDGREGRPSEEELLGEPVWPAVGGGRTFVCGFSFRLK